MNGAKKGRRLIKREEIGRQDAAVTTLDRLQPGEWASVERLASQGSMRRRLLDMGLVEGTRVQCLMRSPSGDPAAYLIRGAVIAIRGKDGAEIQVTRQPEEETRRETETEEGGWALWD